jgi:hypothetical protein
MEKIHIEYLKADTIEEEFEIEQFWIDIRKYIYEIEPDHSLVYFNVRRGHASAYIGEYAGVFFQILLTIVPFVEASISIWEKVYNHIKSKRENGKIVRILNLTLLENLCKYDLIVNKNVKNAEIVKSEKLVDIDVDSYGEDIDFPYEETLDKVECAKITFDSKKHKFIYTIASDGDIISFEKIDR